MSNSVFNANTNVWWVNGTQRFTNIHLLSACEGENCIVHNPTWCPANKGDWPYSFRADGRIERICPHGIGHPDPDQVNFLISQDPAHYGGWVDVHGCDGCCYSEED